MKIDNWQKRELFGLLFWGFIGLVVMILVMSLAGCGSSKSNLRQESSVEENFNHTRNDSTSVSKEVIKTETEESIEQSDEVTTVYDTSKPVDSVTGKYPVLSETKKITKKEKGTQKQENIDTQLNKSKKELSSRDSKSNNSKEEHAQRAETTIPKQIGGVVWALTALAGLVIVRWLIYKFNKKNKPL